MISSGIEPKIAGDPKINFLEREIYLSVNRETAQKGIICKYIKEENMLLINRDSILDKEGELERLIAIWDYISYFKQGVNVQINLGWKDPQNPFIYRNIMKLGYLPEGYLGQGVQRQEKPGERFNRLCKESFSD